MAAGGLACTGCSGEDYAVPGRNALVLETDDPREFLSLFERLRTHPRELRALRRAGRWTARQFAWPEIVQRLLVPRVELTYGSDSPIRKESRLLLRALPGKGLSHHGLEATAPARIEDALPTSIGVATQAARSVSASATASRLARV
jgi:hypothetical protein